MEEKSTSKLMEILKHTKKTELAALQDDLRCNRIASLPIWIG